MSKSAIVKLDNPLLVVHITRADPGMAVGGLPTLQNFKIKNKKHEIENILDLGHP